MVNRENKRELPQSPAKRPTARPPNTSTVPPSQKTKPTSARGSIASSSRPRSRPAPAKRSIAPVPPRGAPATPSKVSTQAQMPPPSTRETTTSSAATTTAGASRDVRQKGTFDTPPTTNPASKTTEHQEFSPDHEVSLTPPLTGHPVPPSHDQQPEYQQPLSGQSTVRPSELSAKEIPTMPPSRPSPTRSAGGNVWKYVILIAGVVGGLAVLFVLGGIFFVTRSSDGAPPTAPVVASGSSQPTASAEQPAESAAIPMPPPNSKAEACRFEGPTKRLVVGVSKDVPIEVWSAPDEPLIAIGLAARNRTGLGFVLDPKTVSPRRSFSKKTNAPIRRIVPIRNNDQISFKINVQDPSASVQDTLTVGTVPPVRLGTFRSALTIGTEAEKVPEIVWQLPFEDPIDTIRAIPAPGKGMGVVLQAKDALWFGWIDAKNKPVGKLAKIPGTGPKVGTPSLGWNGREASLVFANLDKADAAWTVRIARMGFGHHPEVSHEWKVPKGDPGGAAIAPNIRGLHDGRWVMVWTEGKSGSRNVRLQTYDYRMLPVGDPFTVSRSNSKAEQGMAVVGNKVGAVFYLAMIGNQYEVWAAGIQCP